MLINNDTSAAPITQLTLTINEELTPSARATRLAMDSRATLKSTIYNDAGVMITGATVSPDAKSLTLGFTGMTAGKRAIFFLHRPRLDRSQCLSVS